MASTNEQTIIPTLHHLTSSQSHRVLFALEELAEVHGTKYKLEIYKRTTQGVPSRLKDHYPLGKSPILTLEENGKPSQQIVQLPQHPGVLTESRLILKYLSDTFSRGMWEPEDKNDKLQDVFLQELANYTLALKVDFALIYEIIPANLPWGFRHIARLIVSPIVNYFIADQQDIYQLMEDTLSEERPWFAGHKIGLADFNMIWAMDMATQRRYVRFEKFPKLGEWYKRITDRPAYKRACEKGGTYNLVTFLGEDMANERVTLGKVLKKN